MKIEQKFTANKDASSVLNSAKNYFVRNGFVDFKESSDAIEFRRGSVLYNFIAFSPLKWKSIISINTSQSGNETEVSLLFDINTIGQSVMQNETAVWQNLANGLQKEIVEGVSEDMNAASKEVGKGIWRLLGFLLFWGIIVGAVAGVLQALLKKYVGINVNLTFIAIFGLFAWASAKYNKKK